MDSAGSKSDENSRSLTYPKTLEIRVKNEKPADAFQNLDIFNYFLCFKI